MSGVSCLYRRPSGIYVVRIAIPLRLRALVGRTEVHVTTGLRDLAAAKLVSLQIQTHWRTKLMTLSEDKLANAGALLHGDGLIPISTAAAAMGLPESTLLAELRNERASLVTQAHRWTGLHVEDLWEVERDFDGAFMLDEVERLGNPHQLSGIAKAFEPAATYAALMTQGTATETVFRLAGSKAFWPSVEIEVPLSAWMAYKADLERIRSRLHKQLPAPVARAAPTSAGMSTSPPSVISDAITVKHGHKKFSQLFELYRKHQNWGEEQKRRMATEARLFIELMDDPVLSAIDVETIQDYAALLGKMPRDIYQSRRRHKIELLPELIKIAEHEKLVCKNPTTIKGHVGRIAEVLGYAKQKGMVHANPASGFKRARSHQQKVRAQDHRDQFTAAELELIFSQPWFINGTGEFTSNGSTNWRPHYYWLPLLALTTGGRLNELAQLDLADVRQSEGGVWYVDFNLEGAEKVDVDKGDSSPDKSLKTVNAIRVVPLHETVVKAGLPEYLSALRKAGHSRLFPELKRDPVKGYGKPAGSWFNGRFLGEKLKIDRNRKKTFHSLRHNFATALERLDQPERVMTQLLGHERGKSQSVTRYAKDRNADELNPILGELTFPCLANLGKFQVKAGLKAIQLALLRKN